MNVSKLSVPVTMVGTLVVCILSAAGSYYKAMADINAQFVVLRLEREQGFVKKEEMARVDGKLDTIREDLAEIKGYLKSQRRALQQEN